MTLEYTERLSASKTMTAKLIFLAVLLLSSSVASSAQSVPAGKKVLEFMGRDVTVVEPELDADGYYSKGPASVCLEAPPQRQCYTAPEDFGRSPTVEVVQLDKNTPALFFSAAGGGVSGWPIHFALLRPGEGKDLENLFSLLDPVSEQSQHAFWHDAGISDGPIFVTANYVWGPDQAHYSEHRYIVSAYVSGLSQEGGPLNYYLDDRYMTVRLYDLDEKADILGTEKPEILARLKRVKAERERQRKEPR